MSDPVETIIKELLDAMGVAYTGVTRSEIAGQAVYSIAAADTRELIGVRGETIHSIDMLVKKIAEKRLAPEGAAEAPREDLLFLVDVGDYRTKQIKDLQTKALMMAERARAFQYDVELTPMSAYERLIIHTTLQDAANVKTESQGEGRNRRVVIRYTSDL